MTRISVLVLIGLLILAAVGLPAPPSLELEPVSEQIGASEEDTVGLSRFLHCPWALSDGRRSSVYVVAAESPTDFGISFVQGGEVSRHLSGETQRDAMTKIENPREVGTSSALVEFSDGPGAIGVLAQDEELLAGDLCSGAIPSTWHLPGGSTRAGERLTLRLFNPFTADARVDLWALSELGSEAEESLEGLTVPSGRTRIVALDEILPGRESLSILVRPSLGSVIPVMVLDTGADAAVWPGIGPSEGWEFPIAGVEGLDTHLVLTNEASLEVNFLVEVFDKNATLWTPLSGVIAGPGQTRIPLGEVPAPEFGIRITGDGPFGAAVIGRSLTGAAGTLGTPTNASTWLVPGPGAVRASARLRLLNAGVADLDIDYTTLTPSGRALTGSLVLVPGSVRTVTVTGPEVVGVRVTGSGAFSVGWWAEADGSVMFGGAVPVE